MAVTCVNVLVGMRAAGRNNPKTISRQSCWRSSPNRQKKDREHMSAIKPKKINLIAVDGTKSTEELIRLLLAALENAGIPVRLNSEERIKYGLDQPDTN
jgi:hypothetical protein